MRTAEYGPSTQSVPAFLTKLWKLVTDVACDDLISWSLPGTSFIIYDEIRFSKDLLPMYFKHNNMASFVRQLNMYGFRKLSSVDQGGMHCCKNEIEFHHQFFIKGQEKMLELIKRKIPTSKAEDSRIKNEYIEELISNMNVMRRKQSEYAHNMQNLTKINNSLCKQVSMLTSAYAKQEAIIQKLVPCLWRMLNRQDSRQEMSLKRKAPLMIDEGEVSSNKVARRSPPYYVHEQDSNQGMPTSPGNVTNRGPVIHDVTDVENGKMFPPANFLCPPPNSTSKEYEVSIVDSPLSCTSSEQAPFTTEPASSMEAINILNQNFERSRNNSLSPPEMSHSRSPLSASSPTFRLPSPPAPTSTYTPASSSISTVIIDETTSDVPLPSTFLPKPENICTDSGMYSMDSIISKNVPIIDEETVSLMSECTSPLMDGGRTSFMMSTGRMTSLMEGEGPSMMEAAKPSLLEGERTSPLMDGGRTSFMMSTGRMTSLMDGERPSLMEAAKPPSLLEAERMSTSLMNGRMTSLMEGERTSLMEAAKPPSLLEAERMSTSLMNSGRTSDVVNGGKPPLMNAGIGMNNGGKVPNGSFIPNLKTETQDVNWMMNQMQQSYASENIDNWLGQIFKTDNLTAGCSLPHNQV